MNVVTLAEAPGGAVVGGTDGPVMLDGRGGGTLLGVRPEEVRLIDGAGLAARVVTVEYLGADSIVTCAVGTEMFAIRAPGRVDLTEGASVRLTWSPDAVHGFDAVSGKRIEHHRPAMAGV